MLPNIAFRRYVVSQAVAHRKHTNGKSAAMEHASLHAALSPLRKAGISVAELVTDQHTQVMGDFSKELEYILALLPLSM